MFTFARFIYSDSLNPSWVEEQAELEALAELEAQEKSDGLW
jgi:hypothetical protein